MTQRIHAIAVAAGLVGAAVQALLLRNLLAHSLPYRELRYPPAEFFARLGLWAPGLSLALCLGLAWWLYRRAPLLAPIVLVLFMPTAVWGLFVSVTTAAYGAALPLGIVNFDHYTLSRLLTEFGAFVSRLGALGGAIGLAVATGLRGAVFMHGRVNAKRLAPG